MYQGLSSRPMASERIPDRLKTQKMCSKTLKDDTYYLQFVPDWFVTQQQLKIWHDDDDYCNVDELIKRYEGHQKRKAQKAKIKEKHLPIASHPDRVMDWCISEDKKKETEKLWK